VDLRSWLVTEIADTVSRLRGQILDQVPPDRRGERPGGGSSINWVLFHSARHSHLTLEALRDLVGVRPAPGVPTWALGSPGAGFDEAEQPGSDGLQAVEVEDYLLAVLSAACRGMEELSPRYLDELDGVVDTDAALREWGLPEDRYSWLYDLWRGRPSAFLIRWPLIGHVVNHVGEAIAVRNRMGLSPF